jgi:hypothetical protein
MTKEPIAINQPFLVGGVNMMYPGDPTAPAGEVVNCRCVMATEAILDSDGLPILKPRTPPYLRGANAVSLPKLPIPEPIVRQTGFVEATTLKQAKQQSIDLINNNTPINITKLSVKSDVDLAQLNLLNKQLNKLVNEYDVSPSYSKSVDGKLSYSSGKRYYGFVKTTYSGNVVELNFGSTKPNQLNIDSRTKGAVYKTEFGSYKFAGKSQIDKQNVDLATLTHEYGHFISVYNPRIFEKYPKLKDYWSEIQTIRDLYKAEIISLRNANDFDKLNEIYLGDYASTNIDEFVAESFTEYKLKTNPSKYANEVGRIIDKYFKKR